MSFLQVFLRLIRIKILAVGVVFLGISAVIATLAITESSYLPASGTIASVDRAKSNYQVVAETSRDGVTTPVTLTLTESTFGRAPAPGDLLQLFQSPSRPDRVSMVGLGARIRDASAFLALGLLLTWLGFGARLHRRKAVAPPEYASSVRLPITADQSGRRNQQSMTSGGRPVFGRR